MDNIGKCCCSIKGVNMCDCTIIHQEQVENVKKNIIEDGKIIDTSNLLKVLSDNTRLKILFALEIEKLCVCDIANVLNMTKSAVSHQLKILRDNKLITFDKIGKSCYYSLTEDNLTNQIITLAKNLL